MAYPGSNLKIIEMKKALTFSILFLMVSCGVQKKIAKDPYVGTYDFTMFELPSMGDVDAKLFIKKEDGKYISEITPASEDQAPVEFELDSTTFEDGIFTIEGYGGGYDIYFELTIEGDILSGSLMGMFDVSGIRVKD